MDLWGSSLAATLLVTSRHMAQHPQISTPPSIKWECNSELLYLRGGQCPHRCMGMECNLKAQVSITPDYKVGGMMGGWLSLGGPSWMVKEHWDYAHSASTPPGFPDGGSPFHSSMPSSLHVPIPSLWAIFSWSLPIRKFVLKNKRHRNFSMANVCNLSS